MPLSAATCLPERAGTLTIRPAARADRAAIRDVLLAAYGQYAGVMAADLFPRYLADLLDLDQHARHGQVLVAELAGQVRGSAAFYPDSSVQGFGWPRGWAGGRGLAVHPTARRRGIAEALLARCEDLARNHRAPVFGFHTASFMGSAIALYERLGYRRSPRFDVDLSARFGGFGAAPIHAFAYVRELNP